MSKGLTAHMVVYNEEQWIWYAIQSILHFVDKILISDTGSDDKTLQILQTIDNQKITCLRHTKVSANELVSIRNQQIQQSRTDWFLLLDGDEVWPYESIKQLVSLLPNLSTEVVGIVVPALLPLGDPKHIQEEKAGGYDLLGKRGHFNIRAYRRVSGYHWQGTYPLEAYVGSSGRSINDQNAKLAFLNKPYWHLRHLVRSHKRSGKKKLEIGERATHELPEVFFLPRPDIVPSPWTKFSKRETILAHLLTPLRKIKRRLKVNEQV